MAWLQSGSLLSLLAYAIITNEHLLSRQSFALMVAKHNPRHRRNGIRRRCLRVGTDCSGVGAALVALESLGIPFEHCFSAELDKRTRDTLVHNHRPAQVLDCSDRLDHKGLPYVDIYINGFPCQPFSAQGGSCC